MSLLRGSERVPLLAVAGVGKSIGGTFALDLQPDGFFLPLGAEGLAGHDAGAFFVAAYDNHFTVALCVHSFPEYIMSLFILKNRQTGQFAGFLWRKVETGRCRVVGMFDPSAQE